MEIADLKNKRPFAVVLGAAFIALALLISGGCSKSSDKEKETSVREMMPNEGDAVQPFRFKTVSGAEFDTRGLAGKIFVINFFASWCGPCRYEAPALEKLYVYFKARGVEFVGVAVQDTDEGVRGFIKKYDITYPVGMDENEDIARKYMIYALPKTFIVGKDGRITYIRSGGISEEELAAEIQRLL